jgi:hypothetical protein
VVSVTGATDTATLFSPISASLSVSVEPLMPVIV